MENNQLRIKIGPKTNEDFQILLGDQDITDQLTIKSIEMKVGSEDLLRLTLDVYADNIEIIPGELVLRTEEWPPRRAWWKRLRDRIIQ